MPDTMGKTALDLVLIETVAKAIHARMEHVDPHDFCDWNCLAFIDQELYRGCAEAAIHEVFNHSGGGAFSLSPTTI